MEIHCEIYPDQQLGSFSDIHLKKEDECLKTLSKIALTFT